MIRIKQCKFQLDYDCFSIWVAQSSYRLQKDHSTSAFSGVAEGCGIEPVNIPLRLIEKNITCKRYGGSRLM